MFERLVIALVIVVAALYLARRYWITFKRAQEKDQPCVQGCSECEVSDHCAHVQSESRMG